MSESYQCLICELPEERCQCEKYCTLCHGEHQVRLCFDGLFYCLECREACDLRPEDGIYYS